MAKSKNVKVEPVQEEQGTVRTIGSKEVGMTPEEKAQKEEELNEKIKEEAHKQSVILLAKTFKTQLLQITIELNKGKTLDGILDEIKNKTSNLSRSTRDFCVGFKTEAILELLDYVKNKK